ncbi:MAG: hypothetical protein ACYS8X_08260 [Planctomycetota bacterium]|jgi:Fe-S-cluster containining protein
MPPADPTDSADPAIDQPGDLTDSVQACRKNRQLLDELDELYRQVDAQIAKLPTQCWGGGGCCRFDLVGHRLYVSTAELARLLEQRPAAEELRRWRCPYQIGPRCTARNRRPLGCRTYFCDTSLDEQFQSICEQFHHRLRDLHDRLGAPYHYVELTAACAALL